MRVIRVGVSCLGRRLSLALLAAVVAVSGCGGARGRVARVVDGRIVDGRFVEPDAYAFFLRGAIAEANGELDDAVRAYEAVSRLDNDDPEVFARIARTRCARDAHDPEARVALTRAFELDADYGPAWAADAACGGGDDPRARAARAEPRDVHIQVSFAKALERSSSDVASEGRARLLALTLEQPESSEALSALAAWADAHDDLDLLVLALSEAPRRVPRLDAVVARGALSLASEGQLARARRVAAALVDARTRRAVGAPIDEATLSAVGRLAVDEAEGRGDEPTAFRRAIAAHMTLAEAGGRAALAGRFALARALTQDTLRADPNDSGARMVLASATSDVRQALFDDAPHGGGVRAPAIACALFGQRLWRTISVEAARAALRAAACEPVAHDDTPVLSLLVDLAARNVVDGTTLPIEGRIELAWRNRVPLPSVLAELDARHELLARAQSDPLSPRAAELAAKLARRGPTDAVVLAALLVVARARGETLDQFARAALVPPANAVLDAALIEALPVSTPEAVRVRARFAGLAVTPAERALVR